MKKLLSLALASALAVASPSLAHPPAELEGFVGARGGQAEMGLENLGYETARTKGLTAYWWNGDEAVCVAIVTSQGRYKSIDIVKPSNCGKKVRSASPPVSQDRADPSLMTSFCKGEAAGQYNTRPANVKASVPLPATRGGFVVTGTVSLGAQGNPPFQCFFDQNGRFQSIEWL